VTLSWDGDLQYAIDKQLGDHPRADTAGVILALLWVAKAILIAADRICRATGRE